MEMGCGGIFVRGETGLGDVDGRGWFGVRWVWGGRYVPGRIWVWGGKWFGERGRLRMEMG